VRRPPTSPASRSWWTAGFCSMDAEREMASTSRVQRGRALSVLRSRGSELVPTARQLGRQLIRSPLLLGYTLMGPLTLYYRTRSIWPGVLWHTSFITLGILFT
jgi:hypothetical protein